MFELLDISKILIDGGIATLLFTIIVLGMLLYNPRLFLGGNDFPPDIVAAAPPQTQREKRISILLTIPFTLLVVGIPIYSTLSFNSQLGGDAPFWPLFWHTFGVIMMPFLFDLIVLDWWMFCTLTPKFVVIPGTEGFAGYKDKLFHLKAHSRGLLYMIAASLFIAGLINFFHLSV
ncbi:MAG: hypothetical protein PVF83_07600 [Anaerolineales bacterium]|jgi:hypothetical protein